MYTHFLYKNHLFLSAKNLMMKGDECLLGHERVFEWIQYIYSHFSQKGIKTVSLKLKFQIHNFSFFVYAGWEERCLVSGNYRFLLLFRKNEWHRIANATRYDVWSNITLLTGSRKSKEKKELCNSFFTINSKLKWSKSSCNC